MTFAEKNTHSEPGFGNDELKIIELFQILWMYKLVIIAVTTLFAVIGIMLALTLPNQYQAEVVLSPASENDNPALGQLGGQLGGLASLAGLTGGAQGDKSALALEVLQSRRFLSQFIEKHNISKDVIAAESWSAEEDSIEYNTDLYNTETNEWLRKESRLKTSEPTTQELVNTLLERIEIVKDEGTGIVRITLEHYSPFLAKEWLDSLVSELNEEMRIREQNEAEKSIVFLEGQIEKTEISDVRLVLYDLVEEQTKILMFAAVRDEYAFKTLDPAIVPDDRSSPNRTLIVLLAILIGIIISSSFVFIIDAFRRRPS